MVEAAPEYTGDVLRVWKEKAVEGGMCAVGVASRYSGGIRPSVAILRVPARGGGGKEELEPVKMGEKLALLES